MSIKILAFAGSNRKESLNNKLINYVGDIAKQRGVDINYFNFFNNPLPLYQHELEEQQGIPLTAKSFKSLMIDSDAFLIASPEYNASYTSCLKNAIDWASRYEESDKVPRKAFKGKFAALCSTSPGELGGLRGLVHIRDVLEGLGTTVIPTQVAIPKGHEELSNLSEKYKERIQNMVNDLVLLVSKVKGV